MTWASVFTEVSPHRSDPYGVSGAVPASWARPRPVLVLVGALIAGLVIVVALRLATTPSTECRVPTAQQPSVIGSGPSHSVNGVGLGYAHSQDGAVAAVREFATVLSSAPLLTHPDSYRTAAATLAAPGATQLAQQAESNLAVLESQLHLVSLAAQGTKVVAYLAPLTYRVDSYTPKKAMVRFWAVEIIAVDGATPTMALWATGRHTLAWVNGDWRLASEEAMATTAVPTIPQPTNVTATLPPELATFTAFDHGH